MKQNLYLEEHTMGKYIYSERTEFGMSYKATIICLA